MIKTILRMRAAFSDDLQILGHLRSWMWAPLALRQTGSLTWQQLWGTTKGAELGHEHPRNESTVLPNHTIGPGACKPAMQGLCPVLRSAMKHYWRSPIPGNSLIPAVQIPQGGGEPPELGQGRVQRYRTVLLAYHRPILWSQTEVKEGQDGRAGHPPKCTKPMGRRRQMVNPVYTSPGGWGANAGLHGLRYWSSAVTLYKFWAWVQGPTKPAPSLNATRSLWGGSVVVFREVDRDGVGRLSVNCSDGPCTSRTTAPQYPGVG